MSTAERPTAPRPLRIDPSGIVTLLLALLVAALLLGVFRVASDMLTKIGIGVILALALDPVVTSVRGRLGWNRGPAAGLVIALVAAAFAVVLVLMGPPAVDQARDFADELPETARQFYDLPFIGDDLEARDFATTVEEWVDDLPADIDDDSVESFVDALIGGVASTLTVLLVAIAVLIDGDSLVGRFRRLIPADRADQADEAGRIFYTIIGKYFAGSLLVAGLNGLYILAIGLILGVPLIPLAAVWAALTNLIPQVGGFLGGSVFVTLALSDSLTTGLIALPLFLVYQQFENHVLQPTIIGDRVNLTPPTTMLAALVGGAAAGVPGALIATPLVGAVKQLFLVWRQPGETLADHSG